MHTQEQQAPRRVFPGLSELGVPCAHPVYRGKVRDVVDLGDRILLVATDRVSAFDRVLGTIPHKGEVLNRLAAWWLSESGGIAANHFIRTVGAHSMLVKKTAVLPVEIIVRAYLTGSAWRAYRAGNPVSGIRFPAGIAKNQVLSEPVITATTKAAAGSHDEPISVAEILDRGIATEELWAQVERTALELFAFGSRRARERGLILVDTKYEFGLDADGRLLVIDEIHTPDSSRYWLADTYPAAFAAGTEPDQLDKEILRAWLAERGFTGDGTPPDLTEDIRRELGVGYRGLFSRVTGQEFFPMYDDLEAELAELRVILAG